MAFEGFSFDIGEIANMIWQTIVRIVTIPVSMWNNAPAWIKYGLLGILVFFAILILIVLIRFRNEWRIREY